jgi:KDO2-lipid IV(A) lauroyltransferase
MSSVDWLARSGVAIVGRTPARVRYSVAATITSASYLGWRSKRLVTQQNMAKVLGLPATDPRVRRAALSAWGNYGRTASQLICLPYLDMVDIDARTEDMTVGMSWLDCAASALEAGKGVVVATAHFGSWDLAGAIVARYFPVSAIADTFKSAALNDLLQGHRRDKQVGIIPAKGGLWQATQDLRENKVVAIVTDRPVAKAKGVEVTYFGHKTYVPGGSAALAVRTGAPIVPGYVWYAPNNRYYIRAFPPIFPMPVSAPEEKAKEIQRLTQYMFSCQEEVVRACPTQWFMFRPFWPDEVALAAA